MASSICNVDLYHQIVLRYCSFFQFSACYMLKKGTLSNYLQGAYFCCEPPKRRSYKTSYRVFQAQQKTFQSSIKCFPLFVCECHSNCCYQVWQCLHWLPGRHILKAYRVDRSIRGEPVCSSISKSKVGSLKNNLHIQT